METLGAVYLIVRILGGLLGLWLGARKFFRWLRRKSKNRR